MKHDASDLIKEFREFKIETKARLDSYPFLNEDNYKALLKESLESVFKEKEKINVLNRIFIFNLVSGTTIILLILFMLYVMLFTVQM